jgi:hypothetical protein
MVDYQRRLQLCGSRSTRNSAGGGEDGTRVTRGCGKTSYAGVGQRDHRDHHIVVHSEP